MGDTLQSCCVKVWALIGVATRPYLAILWEFEDNYTKNLLAIVADSLIAVENSVFKFERTEISCTPPPRVQMSIFEKIKEKCYIPTLARKNETGLR